MWNNMCQEVGTQSIWAVKLRFFCIFLGVTFLRLMYSIQYLNTIVKNFLYSILHLISVFPCCIFPLSFSDSSLEVRNETLKTPNWILKQWVVYSKFSLSQSILARFLQSADKIYRFFHKNCSKIQFDGKKAEIRFHQLQQSLWEWRLFDKLFSVFLNPFLTS